MTANPIRVTPGKTPSPMKAHDKPHQRKRLGEDVKKLVRIRLGPDFN